MRSVWCKARLQANHSSSARKEQGSRKSSAHSFSMNYMSTGNTWWLLWWNWQPKNIKCTLQNLLPTLLIVNSSLVYRRLISLEEVSVCNISSDQTLVDLNINYVYVGFSSLIGHTVISIDKIHLHYQPGVRLQPLSQTLVTPRPWLPPRLNPPRYWLYQRCIYSGVRTLISAWKRLGLLIMRDLLTESIMQGSVFWCINL